MAGGNISSEKIDLLIYGPSKPIVDNGFSDQFVLHSIETTADLEGEDGTEVAELEPDHSGRPVISTKLAMRRLARSGKSAATRARQESTSSKTAPSSTLSVVRRAQQAKVAREAKAANKPKADAAKHTHGDGHTPSGRGASPVRRDR